MANRGPCLEMDIFSRILKFTVERGWITEHERQRVDGKTTLSEKKSEFFDVLKTMECEENAIRLLRAIRSMNEFESLCKGNGEDEHHCTTVMSKLFKESLLAQGKKLRLENIKKKKDSVANVGESSKMAMSLGPVIRCVLQYLNLKDIKMCRSVSKEWKSIAEPILRNRTKIKFHDNETSAKADATLFHPYKYLEQFASTLETMPFTAFEISSPYWETQWTCNELNDFFQRESGNIRELEINRLGLLDDDGQNITSFNITPWIEISPVTKRNTKYNTKLSIFGDFSESDCTKLIVQYPILAYVKELSIHECRISLKSNQDEQIKLQPIKLKLSNVSFFRDGKFVEELSINEIVDFSRAKCIDLERSKDNRKATKLSLSLKGTNQLHLNYLYLNGVTVKNLRKCTWTIDKLKMRGTSFQERNRMQIRELDLSCLDVISLSVLPQSLNKLTINFDKNLSCLSSQNIILDNLEYLKLTELTDEILSSISNYVKCPNLISLYLDAASEDGDDLEIDLDWIPRSVKKVKLIHVTVDWREGNKDFNLEKLVLADHYFSSVKKMGNILNNTKELVLDCHDDINSESVGNLLEYLRLKKCSNYLQRIYLGPLEWGDYSFDESLLVDYMNMKGEYYIFENQIGKAKSVEEVEGWYSIGLD